MPQPSRTWRRRDLVRLSLRTRSLYPLVLAWFAQTPAEVRSTMRVLDLPAGSGVLSAPLRAAGFDVTPADLFPEYLQAAQRRLTDRGVIDVFMSRRRQNCPAGSRRRSSVIVRRTRPGRPI